MRIVPILFFALTLASCDMLETPATGPVDAAKLAPMSSKEKALLLGADGALQQGNIDAAEKDYLTAVSMNSGYVDGHLALANLYDKQHAYDKERAILERALTLQPSHAFANYLLGKRDLDENRFDEAQKHFDAGLKSQPDNIDLNTGKGVANDMMGNHTDAQMIYLRAARVNKGADLTSLNTNLAMSYLLSGNAQKAIEVLQPIVRQPNAPIVARHNLALAYGMLGRHEDAKRNLKGDLDEPTRMLAIARMREYWNVRGTPQAVPPMRPAIKDSKLAKPAPAAKNALSQEEVGLPSSSALAKAVAESERAKKAAEAAEANDPNAQ